MNATRTPWFVLNSPELGRPFADLCESCRSEGVLDDKTKELLQVVLACVFRSPGGTEAHLRSALEAGATREEITEALLIAAVQSADAQVAWNKEVFMKYLG